MLATNTSPQRRRRQLESARDFLARLRAGFPGDTPEQIAERYVSHVREMNLFDDAQQEIYVLDPLREWILATIAAEVRKPKPASPEVREKRRAQREAIVKAIASKVEKKVEDRAQELFEVRLLEYQTIYGKPLARCTGAECSRLGHRYGEFFAEIAKRLRPSEHVEAHLSEAELQAIAQVHYLLGPKAGTR